MSTKQAQIIINVDDKSLVELNAEIKQLETSIGQLKVGTAEWQKQNQKLGQLKTQFNSATKEAQKLQNVVAGTDPMSLTNGIKGVAKLGAGLVGTFTAVSGSMKLIGGNSEAWDEMTAKAATLMSVMGGLNQVSEMFGKDTMGVLKGLGTGFKGLVTTVRGASTGIKAALVSTGIGALVVAVGLLIANFDKIKNLLNRQAEKDKKAAEDNLKLVKAESEITTALIKQRQESLKNEKESVTKRGDALRLAQIETEEIRWQIAELEDRKKVEEAEADVKIASLAKESKLKGIALSAEKGRLESLKIENSKIIDLQIKGLKLRETEAESYQKSAEAVQLMSDKIKANENRLTVLNSLADKQRQIYLVQLDTLQKQVDIIKQIAVDRGEFTKADKEELDRLNAQITALQNQETERIKILNTEIKQLEYEQSIQNVLIKTQNIYREINLGIQEQLLGLEANTKYYQDQVKAVEEIQKDYDKLQKARQEIVNFDQRGVRLFHEQNAELEQQFENYKAIFDEVKNTLVSQLQTSELNDRISQSALEKGAQELALYTALQDKTREKLEGDKRILEKKKEAVEWQKKESIELQASIDNQVKYYEKQLETARLNLENARNDEEQKTALEKVIELESKVNELSQQTLDSKQAVIDADKEIQSINTEILETNQAIDQTVENTLDKQKEVTAEIENQSRAYVALQDFIGKYQQEIQVAQQLLAQSLEFIAALQDRKAQIAQDRIDDLNKQMEELEDAEDDRQSKLEEYEELLKDANGDRYEELLDLIQKEKDANLQAQNETQAKRDEINAKIKDEENKKLAAEARAAKWRKAQALIDAVIQGALAVIKALPNVFLSVATGVLAAAGIATIAAQKTPDIPKGYKAGGFTGIGNPDEVAGVTHKGEYVVPAHVVSKPENQSVISALETQRLRGFKEGGLVPAINTSSENFIDYDRLGAIIINGLRNMPAPVVSVQKITTAQNEVAVTKANAGL